MNIAHETQAAPGRGPLASPVVIVGQSLCTKCMESQILFDGGGGLILDDALGLAGGRTKDDVFITNVVHCHPPKNRKSRAREKDNCRPYLIRELAIVRPWLVIGLGDDAQDALQAIYPKARELSWEPLTLPRTTQPPAAPWPDLLFAQHPGSFRWKPKEIREQEVERYKAKLARALRWGFRDRR